MIYYQSQNGSANILRRIKTLIKLIPDEKLFLKPILFSEKPKKKKKMIDNASSM